HSVEQELKAGADWRETLRPLLTPSPERNPESVLVPLGQEIAFAGRLARQFGTVGGIPAGFRTTAADSLGRLESQRGLAAAGPVAQAHRSAYPLVQGPMTRVSDVVPFCLEVARNGALPFLALALLRGPECRQLLTQARDQLGSRSWGVGILGFVPPELRAEQL